VTNKAECVPQLAGQAETIYSWGFSAARFPMMVQAAKPRMSETDIDKLLIHPTATGSW